MVLGKRWQRESRARGRYAPRLWPVWLVAPFWVATASLLAWIIYLQLRAVAVPGPPGPNGGPSSIDPLDVIKTTIAVAGFVGAVLVGVYAYRKQRLVEGDAHRADAEQLAQRYTTAAEQLGHEKAAVRLAGVYAMARLADDWDEQRQVCIDVLCAYLRMPYEPDHASEKHREGEREVRLTIIRLIRDHLRYPSVPTTWCGYNLNFANATFDGGDFSRAKFTGGEVSFSGAEFTGGEVSFVGAEFTGGEVDFSYAKLTGGKVSFFGAEFSGGEVFFGAKFTGGEVDFSYAKFTGGVVRFQPAEFTGGKVFFNRAEFTAARSPLIARNSPAARWPSPRQNSQPTGMSRGDHLSPRRPGLNYKKKRGTKTNRPRKGRSDCTGDTIVVRHLHREGVSPLGTVAYLRDTGQHLLPYKSHATVQNVLQQMKAADISVQCIL